MNLKGKKVTVMGLGLYEDGSGISATKFLVDRGAKVTVTDLKTAEQLKDQLKRLRKIKSRIKLVLGEHREEDFKNADLILKNPGVPRTSKFLKIANDNNIPIQTDISLFFTLCDRKRIIGITGTRGKSTITTLIYELIKSVDKDAVLAGNILKSPLAQMTEIKKSGPVVLELSSWMTESLESIEKSPHIAVFTNIYPDHLNTYDSINDYAQAKTHIFKYQTPQDYVILNRDNSYTFAMGKKVLAQRYWFSLKNFKEENGSFIRTGNIIFRQNGAEHKICSVKDLKIPGEHNLANVLAAVGVAGIYGLKPAIIKKIVSNFSGVPNRLELLREVKGVKYYNDTTSTTPEATIAALRALKKYKKKIVLIAGGADKGLDFKQVTKEMRSNCKTIILLNGTGTIRLKKELDKLKNKNLTIADSMADAVGVARSFAQKGDIVLLSPACASFVMFNNEFDRGDQFRKIVKSLK